MLWFFLPPCRLSSGIVCFDHDYHPVSPRMKHHRFFFFLSSSGSRFPPLFFSSSLNVWGRLPLDSREAPREMAGFSAECFYKAKEARFSFSLLTDFRYSLLPRVSPTMSRPFPSPPPPKRGSTGFFARRRRDPFPPVSTQFVVFPLITSP